MARMTGEERKKVLIKSAIKVFAEENYRAAKVADIATNADVTEPIVYKHFSSKKNLYLEVLTLIMEKTMKRFQNVIAKSMNPLEKLELIIKEYNLMIHVFRQELKLEFQAVSEIDDPDVKEIIATGYLSSFKLVENLLQEGMDQGYFREDIDPAFQAKLFVGHFIHVSSYYLSEVLEDDYSEQLFSYYLNGIVHDS
ncbi:TetR/AcrR family transcriptional regulator [Sporosarcina sp. BI001-red]|uniref:TetR/AcrR family transcriptional regulator n=1 Tax=Sporosarcina sp. BI001-red TaxID=2282866 RepID=UPI000E24374F|nr:TetR/AcrR family transcriptional regulator [Sporosarcina sp. BI001-red]REB08745.1 TetR/AcrR family transcriptional regulator [Sporosarcina sp. BI001-red]